MQKKNKTLGIQFQSSRLLKTWWKNNSRAKSCLPPQTSVSQSGRVRWSREGQGKAARNVWRKDWPSRSVLFVQVCIWERACVLLCVSVSSTLTAREWLWDWNVVPVRAFFKIRNILALQTNWGYFWSQRSFVLILLQSSIPRLPLKKTKKTRKTKKTHPPLILI